MSHDERPGDATEPGFRLSPPETPTDRLPGTASLDLDVEGRTHPGKVRDHNEDTFSVEPPTSARARAQGTLLIVSDGMGGHAAGEVASAIAVETIPAAYYRDQPRAAAGSDSPPPVAEALVGAVLEANAAIYAEAERTPERQGMGCTVVAAVVQASELIVAHVGDSRAYLVHSGQIRQLTRDHSWVGQQVAAGILTPEQAERHPRRSLLLQALGRESQVEVEVGEHPLESGDVLVICSDGLTSVVRDAEIAERVSRLAPRVATERLIALANERGAPDNVTVVVAAIGDVVTSPLPATTQEEITHRRIVADADAEGDTVRLSRSLSAAAGARRRSAPPRRHDGPRGAATHARLGAGLGATAPAMAALDSSHRQRAGLDRPAVRDPTGPVRGADIPRRPDDDPGHPTECRAAIRSEHGHRPGQLAAPHPDRVAVACGGRLAGRAGDRREPGRNGRRDGPPATAAATAPPDPTATAVPVPTPPQEPTAAPTVPQLPIAVPSITITIPSQLATQIPQLPIPIPKRE